MKNTFFVALASLAILLGGCATQGQFGQQARPDDQWYKNENTGRWQQGKGGTSINVGAVTSGAQASGIGKCEVVGGLAGAGAGALIGGKENRGLGALLGGILGAFAGNKYCEDDRGNVVRVSGNRCKDGEVWDKLNWPGHPQHGDMVCMSESDSHRGSKAKLAEASSGDKCKSGQVWAKLNWPGHPQHGDMVCMSSDDKHKGE